MPGKQLDSQAADHSGINKQILFIRHGESDAHVGKGATHIEVVGLTESGKVQALKIAQEISHPPDLIVVSPYLRAWETADPTMKRFPGVPHAIWQEVREFTYLGSLAGTFMTKDERSTHVHTYWERGDPKHNDGNGESFSAFIGRVRKALEKLREELEEKNYIVVFTHEQFIRAVQCLLLRWGKDVEDTSHCMKSFREMLLAYPLPYGYKDDESWQLHLAQQRAALQEDILQGVVVEEVIPSEEILASTPYASKI